MPIEDLKKEIIKLFNIFAVEHPSGHQNEKLNRYKAKDSALCFAFEKDHKTLIHIWCPKAVDDHVTGVKKEMSPRSKLWQEINAKGEKQYGRHAGIKSTKELCDIDLVKFTPSTLAEAQKVIEGIKIASRKKSAV